MFASFVTVYIVFLCLHLIAEHKNNPLFIKLTKPLLLITLLIFYVTCSDSINIWVVLALLAGLSGDVFLMFPKKQSFFLPGLLSFLLGHLAYIYIFITVTNIFEQFKLVYLFIFVPYLLYGFFVYKILRPTIGKMLIPVCVYAMILAIMGICSFGSLFISPLPYALLPIVGSLLFMISDTALAFTMFTPKKFSGVFVMTTYGLAQLFLVCWFISI